jgi:iron complex outermembrane receptor protein
MSGGFWRHVVAYTKVMVFVGFLSVAVRAQETPTVSGRVLDPDGAAIPKAVVLATPESGGAAQSVESDGEGRYVLAVPAPGRYRLHVEQAGFSPATRVVEVSRSTTVDWALSIGSVIEQLTVVGEGAPQPRLRTATKSDTPLREVPFSVSTVPQVTMRNQFALTMTEALRNVAGSSPQPGFGGLNALPRIRGFQANGNLRNGFRQETFYAQLDMSNIERIEVLKGPASALYGRFEPGGVVNIVTKRPLAERRQAVEFSSGSNDLYRVSLDSGGPIGGDKLRYRFNLAYENANSYRDFVDTRKVVITPSIEWRPSNDTTVAFDTQFLHRDGGFDRGFIVFGGNAQFASSLLRLPPERNLGEPTDSASYRGTLTSVTVDHRFSSAWSLRAGGFVATSSLDDDFFTSGSPLMPNATTYNRRMLYATDRALDYTMQVEAVGRVTTGRTRHQLLVGTDGSTERYRYQANRVPTSSPINPFAPVYGQANYGPPFVEVWDGRDRYRAAGLYAQDEMALGRVRVLLGGRFDRTAGSVTSIGDGEPDTVQERTTTSFSPRVGVTYVVSPSLSVYGSAGRSFLTEIFGVQLNGELTDPSHGRQFETGIKTDTFGGRLSTTVALYHLAKTNVVVDDPDNPGYSIQTGEQRSRGLEIESLAAFAKGLSFTGAYAYNDAAITRDTNAAIVGNRFINTAPHTFSAWFTKDTPVGRGATVTLGGGVYHVGDRPVNNGNLFVLPAYTRVDALVAVSRGAWRVAFNGRNLADTRYFDSGGSVYYPGAPRQVFVSVDWRTR